jgi:hypothetical protein
MSDQLVSVDEFLSARKDFVKTGDILIKASRGAASSWNRDKRTVRFVMSAEVEDRDRDIILQDGIRTEAFLENPQAFFNHRSYGRPVGTWSDVEKVLKGRPKRTEGLLTLAPEGINQDADFLALDIDAGLIKACSIGFIPKAVKKRPIPEDKKDADYYWPGYEILDCELVECSPCTIPSNPAALAKSAAEGNVLAKELIEEVLDNWAKDPATGILMRRSDFEAAHKSGTGNKTTVVEADTSKLAGLAKQVQEAVDAIAAEVKELGLADTGQTTTDKAAAQDDAGPGKIVVLDAHQTVKHDDVPETADVDDPKLTQPQARSFLRKLLDLAFGEENQAKVEQELRAKRHAEVEATVADATRKEALQHRFQSLEARMEGKGLV